MGDPFITTDSATLVPLAYQSNGESGDGQTVCSVCGAETDDEHTPADCYEQGKRTGALDATIDASMKAALADLQPFRDLAERWREIVALGVEHRPGERDMHETYGRCLQQLTEALDLVWKGWRSDG